jgi:anaerobic magnesium-protoporphyrin IX monomethyl ester cyclase
MNTLLTHGYFLEEDEKEKLIMKPYPPLGILCISAFLEKNDVEHDLFDTTFSSFEKLKDKLIGNKPQLIGIYTNLMTRPNVLRIISFIRNNKDLSSAFIVLGGPEVRNHIAQFLSHGADALVLGEGEESMLELAQMLRQHGADLRKGNLLSAVKGIAYIDEDGKIHENAARPLIKDIDTLPFPNRKKIDLNRYFSVWKNKHGESAASVSTMRGCPYSCRWCSRAVYGGTYRRRSPVHVADELEWLQKNYSFDTVWFVDDVFTISHKWLKEFRDEIIKRKIHLRFECITRADRLNDEVMKLLKESGCFRVWIGAESGSQKILDAMDRRVEVQQVRDMIVLAKRTGIQAGTFIMLGYPGETEEDIEETIRHLVHANPDHYTITVAYPIKGTPLYTEVENDFTKNLVWEESTDRDQDFTRTYPRRYYDFALRRLYNEVAYHRALREKKPLVKQAAYKMKSLAAKGSMIMIRMMNNE